MKIPLILSGHGGEIAGVYQTKGKRFIHENGLEILEGVWSRFIKGLLLIELKKRRIPYVDLVPEQTDIDLYERIDRANNAHREHNYNTLLFDIHSNAAPSHLQGQAHGSEVHISKKASNTSKKMAKVAGELFKKHFPEARWRSTKHKKWLIVRRTIMPAVLIEVFFMDNLKECETYLMSDEGRDRIVQWLADFIEYCVKNF